MRPSERAHPAPFVHLGDRLLAIARIRSGAASIDAIAQEFGLEAADIVHWLEAHAGDRIRTFDELRYGSEEMRGLERRARRLAELVADADRQIRDLHQEYLLMVASRGGGFIKEFE
jgi:hypothetical protein